MAPYAQQQQVNAGGSDLEAFFQDVDRIRSDIMQFEDRVSHIEALHARTLNEIDEENQMIAEQQLEALATDVSSAGQGLKKQIQLLENSAKNDSTKRIQTQNVKRKFMDAIQRYQSVEAAYRSRYKQRAARQYRIVRPEATDEEVNAAIEDSAGQQIFSQALLQSNRRGEARTALTEVQARHRDIQRIERTMAELAQLFKDMELMVAEQDTMVAHIDDRAQTVQNDIEQGVAETDKAVQHAKAARRKRWICFGIICAILIIVAVIIIAWYFSTH
ncbi:hypothetical protein CANCADRAFT_3168 [Tortispora caseinolytica NRRL Y-17796]|uniref:t-SNARE coiled-coil homology domain-containing protein n=1 Tax=Tortispora caseinolytica NRRL Y-17796 TaxID=767744 RepID=A0A1E4T9W3_9ASCO|nr:hypothetical protein CANCADRAFT_3168 [Tortispora caseinolytica NRRL Y-17796]